MRRVREAVEDVFSFSVSVSVSVKSRTTPLGFTYPFLLTSHSTDFARPFLDPFPLCHGHVNMVHPFAFLLLLLLSFLTIQYLNRKETNPPPHDIIKKKKVKTYS